MKEHIRYKQRGSLLMEMLIVIGLISALVPILYKHISDRREEIVLVNNANTLLRLQRETEDFLRDNSKRNSLTFSEGKAVIAPSRLGSNINSVLDSRYVIGLKKVTNGDGSETITAIIAEKEGSGGDVRASKVANLIGISAGIKSAMNDNNAYGVNGVWEKQLSDYGLSNIPAGSVVVTTEYNKGKNTVYSSNIIVDNDINIGNARLTAEKIVVPSLCIGGTDSEHCRDKWDNIDTNIMLLKKCYDNLDFGITRSDYCNQVRNRHMSDSCKAVAKTYEASNLRAPSGYYYIGNPFTKKACYFIYGQPPLTIDQVASACNDTSNPDHTYACEYEFE